MATIHEGGSFETFNDVMGNPLIALNRDGTINTRGIDFSDGTQQTTAASGGGTALVASTKTTNYSFTSADLFGFVIFNSASALSGTLPQANTLPANWFVFVSNANTGAVTITPTASTISGQPSLILSKNQTAMIVSNGTNFSCLFTKISSTDAASSLGAYVVNDAGTGAAQNQIVMRNINTGVNSLRKGFNIYLEHDGAQANANYDGLQVNVGFQADGNTAVSQGHTDAIEAYVAGNGPGAIGQLNAIKTRIAVTNGAIVTNAVGFLLYLPTVDATSSIANYSGFTIDTPTGGGVVTNWVGVVSVDPGVGVVTTAAYGAGLGGKSGALLGDIGGGGGWGFFSHIGHADLHGGNMPFTLKDGWYAGNGTPEGSMTAVVSSIASRLDGGASATGFYVKESGSGNTGWKGVITASGPPKFTVAALPAGTEGAIAYATNGRKVGEGPAAGTGVPIYFSNTQWRVYSTDAPVAS